MAMKIAACSQGNGFVAVQDGSPGGFEGWSKPIKAVQVKRHPWRSNNRRTDLWFDYAGWRWHGHCSESTTIFVATALC